MSYVLLSRLVVVTLATSASATTGYFSIHNLKKPIKIPVKKELLDEQDYQKALGPIIRDGSKTFVNLGSIEKLEKQMGCKILFVKSWAEKKAFPAIEDVEWNYNLQKEMLSSLNVYTAKRIKELCSEKTDKIMRFARDHNGSWWSQAENKQQKA